MNGSLSHWVRGRPGQRVWLDARAGSQGEVAEVFVGPLAGTRLE